MKRPLNIVIVLMAMGCSLVVAEEPKNQLRNLAAVPVKDRNPVAKQRVWPAKVGEADICVWKDDKLAAFCITIDDNTKPDHAWWLETTKKYGYPVTWFAVTSGPNKNNPRSFGGTWADFQKLIDAGHDVQSHSVTHRSNKSVPIEKDYADAITHVNENLKNAPPCLTLAYPGGKLPNDPKVAAKYYAAARGTRGTVNGPLTDYMDTRSIGSAKWAFTKPGEKGSWASIRPLAKDPKHKLYRGWYCMHFHGVAWKDSLKESVAKPLIKLLDYIKANEKDFWVGTFRQIALYGQERDTATLTVTTNEPKKIVLTLTDRMYDKWFNIPLTVKVHVPNDWKGVSAKQGEKSTAGKIIEHEGNKFALVQAVPDQGAVTLIPGLPPEKPKTKPTPAAK